MSLQSKLVSLPIVKNTVEVEENPTPLPPIANLGKRGRGGRRPARKAADLSIQQEEIVEEVKKPVVQQREHVPTYGIFERDIPERVVGAKVSSGHIYVTIEWQARSDCSKPEDTTFLNEVVKEKCPKLLVDFYESRINARSTAKPP